MSSLSDAYIVALLNNAVIRINRYFGIFIFIFGTIGNILNIFVLLQKTLRSNPCTWLFLMSSIASLIASFFGLTTRILSSWGIDPSETNQGLCKSRGLIAFTSVTATFWLLALATIDRWLSSSILTHRRQKSTLKNAQHGTIIIACLSIGLYIQILFCYEANLTNTPTKCYSKSSACRLVSDLSFALITILCPLLLMVLFGLMTISNVRQTHRRIQPIDNMTINNIESKSATTNGQQNQRKKRDRQLLIMLFFQVTVLTLLTLQLPIQRFYSTFTMNYSKSILQQAIENFLYNLALLAIYLANGIPFYVYTLSGGSIFRKALLNVLQMFKRWILCQ